MSDMMDRDGNYPEVLFRSDPIEEDCDYREDYVREPEGDCRRKCAGMDEHLAEA